MKTILTIILVLSPFFMNAQTDCPCCSEPYKQFDFWLGDWVVYDSLGNALGENLIVKLEDGCLINENWTGKGISSGRSYNYYNKQDSTWNQLWVDNNATHLILKGKASKNSMVLKSELTKGKKVPFYYNQITWTLNDDGSVTQVWEIFDDKNNLLTTAFLGIYKKKEEK